MTCVVHLQDLSLQFPLQDLFSIFESLLEQQEDSTDELDLQQDIDAIASPSNS